MKKMVATLAFALLTSIAGMAQNWSVGPELGANIIPVEKNDLGTNFKLGWHAGVQGEYAFNDYFSLRSGIYATQKKQNYASFDSSAVNLFGLEDFLDLEGVNLNTYSTTNGAVSQFYLELPLLATYTYENFSVFAGPYVGYMLNARTRERVDSNTPFLQVIDLSDLGIDPTGGLLDAFLPAAQSSEFSESSAKTGLQTVDFGIKAGMRYEMDQLGINLAYQHGLLDYQTSNKSTKDVHNYVQVSLTYNFEF